MTVSYLTGQCISNSLSLCPDGSPRAKCTGHLCSFLTASTGPLSRDQAPKLKRDIAIFHPGKNTLLPTDITLPQGPLPGDVGVTNLEIKDKPRASLTRESDELSRGWWDHHNRQDGGNFLKSACELD